jgi:hypothetical protein
MSSDLRAWVRLPSGKRLDLLNPTPFDWDDEDLALGLARTYRWGGHSAWPLPLSVAQHSLTVLALRRHWAGSSGLAAVAELRELLHDADEGLLGFDCISPLKAFMGGEFKALTGRLEQVVKIRYDLRDWTGADYSEHKRADRIAAASEAAHVVGWPETEIRQTLKIRFKPLEADLLHGIYGGTPWEPWTPDVAAQRFLKELRRLQAKV